MGFEGESGLRLRLGGWLVDGGRRVGLGEDG